MTNNDRTALLEHRKNIFQAVDDNDLPQFEQLIKFWMEIKNDAISFDVRKIFLRAAETNNVDFFLTMWLHTKAEKKDGLMLRAKISGLIFLVDYNRLNIIERIAQKEPKYFVGDERFDFLVEAVKFNRPQLIQWRNTFHPLNHKECLTIIGQAASHGSMDCLLECIDLPVNKWTGKKARKELAKSALWAFRMNHDDMGNFLLQRAGNLGDFVEFFKSYADKTSLQKVKDICQTIVSQHALIEATSNITPKGRSGRRKI